MSATTAIETNCEHGRGLLGGLVKSMHDGWFTDVWSSKRARAIRKVWGRMQELDPEAYSVSESMSVIFVAPTVSELGWTLRRPPVNQEFIIYLAPQLEFCSQADVNQIAAHEVAHLVLKHCDKALHTDVDLETYQSQPHEVEARQLGERWGFPERQNKTVWNRMVAGFVRTHKRHGRSIARAFCRPLIEQWGRNKRQGKVEAHTS